MAELQGVEASTERVPTLTPRLPVQQGLPAVLNVFV
eukprot:CAMPEP_0184292480 /NCGR_PEP_ID=MMETSP1049-20130417/4254_1 /TAXON_ID=77928 /ORGANISM="Proteomonas sulcata, Strain CCMP704" /LENGTH=35 /DNA_ID= /DNA_START= /DNA_END= /DNA_ORIENTATION=